MSKPQISGKLRSQADSGSWHLNSQSLFQVLREHNGITDSRDAGGMNVLHHAGEAGRIDCLKWLIELPEVSDAMFVQRSNG